MSNWVLNILGGVLIADGIIFAIACGHYIARGK